MMDHEFGADAFADDDTDRIAALDIEFWLLIQEAPPPSFFLQLALAGTSEV